MDVAVRGAQRIRQAGRGLSAVVDLAELGHLLHHRLHGHQAGDFTRRMSPHTVGDDEHAPMGVHIGIVVVFVARPDHPHIRAGRPLQTQHEPQARCVMMRYPAIAATAMTMRSPTHMGIAFFIVTGSRAAS